MASVEQIHIHCASAKSHSALLDCHANDILKLSEQHTLHVFSPSETSDNAKAKGDATVSGDLIRSQDGFDVAQVFKHLETFWLGQTLVHLSKTSSTQDILKKTIPWCGEGWVALTGCQTAGRGRRGTSWTSPVGSVALSIALRVGFEHAERLTFMQYLAALAAVEAVREPEWKGLRLQVKWPNDVYKEGLKVGGVLCEAVARNRVFEVVVGVGINVVNEAPTTCLKRGGGRFVREMFVAHYLSAFEKLYDQFCQRGFEGPLMEKYLAAWMHSGQVVRISDEDGPRAIVKGLAPNGWVRVFREDLQAYQDLAPDVTSLDLTQNVFKEKVAGHVPS